MDGACDEAEQKSEVMPEFCDMVHFMKNDGMVSNGKPGHFFTKIEPQ